MLQRARTAGLILSLGLLSALLFTHPAQAAECLPREGTFLPGTWVGHGFRDIAAPLENQYMDASEEAAFDLTVDEGGAAEGSVALSGGGSMASSDVIGASTAVWELLGDISGSASLLRVSGTLTWVIDGVVEVGEDGPIGFDGGLEREIEGTFAAVEADCSMAYGSFAGLGAGEEIAWVAARDGDGAKANDVVVRFNQVMAHVHNVIQDANPDLDELDLAVREMIALNDLIGQSTACGEVPASMALGSPAAAFARDTLGVVLERFLQQALEGAYTASEIVRATTLGLASGMFDLPQCGATPQATDVRTRILTLLRQVLAERVGAVAATPQTAEYRLVVAALHQFGMTDLLGGAR